LPYLEPIKKLITILLLMHDDGVLTHNREEERVCAPHHPPGLASTKSKTFDTARGVRKPCRRSKLNAIDWEGLTARFLGF